MVTSLESFVRLSFSCRTKDGTSNKEDKSKTLIQLAKMVQNGKLKIPSSLVEYIDDHTSLIDQIFTILTIEDIEGMLPDILKVTCSLIIGELAIIQGSDHLYLLIRSLSR